MANISTLASVYHQVPFFKMDTRHGRKIYLRRSEKINLLIVIVVFSVYKFSWCFFRNKKYSADVQVPEAFCDNNRRGGTMEQEDDMEVGGHKWKLKELKIVSSEVLQCQTDVPFFVLT